MMQTMPYNLQQSKGSQIPPNLNYLDKFQQVQLHSNNTSRATSSVESEPTSVVDTLRRSPSPQNSTSTLSSSFTATAVAVANPPACTHDVAGGFGVVGSDIGLEEWDSLLPWISVDPVDDGVRHLLQSGNIGLGVVDQTRPTNGFNLSPNQVICGGGGIGGSLQVSPPFGDGKPQIFNPQLMMNQQQVHSVANPSFVMCPATLENYCHQLEQFQPQLKRHNPGVGKTPFLDQQSHVVLPPQFVPHQFQQNSELQIQEQGVKDQLFKAADLIQTGNFSLAQEILARLNQLLSFPAKPPVIRAALYVKEALQMLLHLSNPVTAPPPKTVTSYDIVHKMNAFKVFSEVSPITQFVNFTCTQAILEALEDVDAIHIVDFDIGCGAQWASLIQELPLRKKGVPSLRITAIVPPTTHSFELALIRENLVQFANDTNIAFEFQVLNFGSFDPSLSSFPNFRTSEDECIAVSIPIWASSTRPSLLPSILRFIKQHSPKIIMSLDKGFDRFDLPFPQHLIHSLESCTNFSESLDGLNVAPDIVSKVEKLFVQPRIENSVLGRLHAPDKIPYWKNLFASVGLVPLQFSNFTETQADYVVKRTPGRGFQVEKRQASLVLSWQRRELVSASAWRC